MDPEFAEQVLALQDSDDSAAPPSAPDISDWTPEYSVLLNIFDRLGDIGATLVAVNNGKYRPPPPARRPVTALQRLRAKRRQARRQALVSEVQEAQQRWASKKNQN